MPIKSHSRDAEASPGIALEKSHEWYGDGDTIVHGVYAEDVDPDSTIEIITVGEVYRQANQRTEAQMKIWNWNSNTQTLTLESTNEWSLGGSKTAALSVHAADIDDDNIVEIVTAGYGLLQNETLHCDLIVWEYSPLSGWYAAVEIAQLIYTMYNSVYSANIDTSDNYLEIAVAGVVFRNPDNATLDLFRWNGTHMSGLAHVEWQSGDTNATAVYAKDVDGDTVVEILTGGYFYSNSDQWAEVRVWNYSNSNLNLEDSDDWQRLDGDTEVRSIFAENIDSDSDVEILACGRAIHGMTTELWGDLESFTHDGTDITKERNRQWQAQQDDTVCSSVFVKEVTGSAPIDIITGGRALISGTQNGQVVVWNRDGATFDSLDSVEWYTTDDTEVHSVYAEDVDADNPVEILSGGQAYDRTRIKAQLRIWYWT
ncbi:MAG: hypothetical protein ACE5QW_04150 [Thermoplasmata archaeon]